jgi:hypothetical protein
LPASGWEMMAKVRRRATGSRAFMPRVRDKGKRGSQLRIAKNIFRRQELPRFYRRRAKGRAAT